MNADVILHNGRFTTLDRSKPEATAVAIANGVFTAVSSDREVMRAPTPQLRSLTSEAAAHCRA
jgi:predicted amidohydrolase YtcJ